MSVEVPKSIGPYEVLGRFAVGGMAELFHARHTESGEEVAIKRMLPHIADDPDGRRMFREEARLGALVNHPNVVRLLGAGSEHHTPYLILEYVSGCDLWRLNRFMRREQRRVPTNVAIYIVRELLAALSAAHAIRDAKGNVLSITHRDVSPSNVLLSTDGEVKLGDFGIAQAGDRKSTKHSRTKGKLGYLSPEQVLGRTPDRRSDVYAAGVVAAELLLGRELFSGGSELAILLSIRDGNIRAFEALEIDPDLKASIRSALHPDREERTQDADTLAAELAPFAGEAREAASELAMLTSQVIRTTRNTSLRTESAAREGGIDESSPPNVSHGDASRANLQFGSSYATGEQTNPDPTRTMDRPTYPGHDPAEEFVKHEAAQVPHNESGDSIDARTPLGNVEFEALQAEAHERTTGNLPPVTYVVIADHTETSYTFAGLVEALTTGVVRRDDLVQIDGASPKPVYAITHLARHLPMSTRTSATYDAPLAREPDRRANFAGGGFVHSLAETVVRRQTGLWLCEHEGARKELYLADGVPQFVGSNLAGELLGEFLVQRGMIDRAELDMALAILPRFDGRLGETLIRLQLVEPVQLFREIEVQVRTKVLDLFVWTRGSAQFFVGVPAPPMRFPLQINAWSLLEEGISARLDKGLETDRFREKLTTEVSRVPQLPSHLELTTLPDELLEIFGFVRSPQLLAILVDKFSTEEEPKRGYRLVLTGLHIGLLRWS